MEEEIIKNANEIIYNAECWIDDEECTDAELEWGKFEKNTVQGLLDLYNKEKEKNKEYIENTELLKKYIRENYISKDKIKEKIEFYKRYGKIKNSNEYVMCVEIEVLEEILNEVE